MSHAVIKDADSLQSEIRDNSVRVVDVRRASDYKRGHITGAVNLQLGDLLRDDSPDSVARLAGSAGIGDDTMVVAYDDTYGALASRLAWSLQYIGHRDVRLLDTTYSNWQSLGLETDSGETGARHAEHSVSLQPGMLATHSYLEDARSRDGVILMDNRERLNYLEQHIPGAINIPYRTLSTRQNILRPEEEILRLMDNRGVRHDSEVITYCGSVGTLSGLAYYALKSAGFDNCRLYVRSFREWKNLEKPTAKQEDANYWDLSAE